MGFGVGLSVLMALKAASLLLLFAFLKTFTFTLLSVPFVYAALVSMLVSLASHPSIDLPMVLGKNQDGSFPMWSRIMFSPYLYFVRVFSFLRRYNLDEDPFTEICDGVYVGGWPYAPDKLPPGNPAIIDCTCELPRIPEFKGHSYMCVPTWDTRSPQPGDIESAVKWACRKRAINQPVFVHCAYGHGKSVAVMCALLVALGVVEDWKKAEKLIKEKRPHISMNSLHRGALEEWSKHRLSPPQRNESRKMNSSTNTSEFHTRKKGYIYNAIGEASGKSRVLKMHTATGNFSLGVRCKLCKRKERSTAIYMANHG